MSRKGTSKSRWSWHDGALGVRSDSARAHNDSVLEHMRDSLGACNNARVGQRFLFTCCDKTPCVATKLVARCSDKKPRHAHDQAWAHTTNVTPRPERVYST